MSGLFENLTIDRAEILGVVIAMTGIFVSFILAWIIPQMLRVFCRDKLKLEYNYNTKQYRECLKKMFLRKNKPDSKNAVGLSKYDEIYVDDDFKKYHHGWRGFLGSNFFMVVYFMFRVFIFIAGVYFSLIFIHQDFFQNTTTLGLPFIVAILQLGSYFGNFFAHGMLILTGKVKLGDLSSIDGGQTYGLVADFNLLYTTMWFVNPNYNWEAKKNLTPNEDQVTTEQGYAHVNLDPQTSQMMPEIYGNPNSLQQFTIFNAINQNNGYSTLPTINKTHMYQRYIPNGHKIYDQEFIEFQVPNTLLMLNTVPIIHH